MTRPIVMPKLGLTMTEGLLASWRVKPGDRVQKGDVLFVVETDKIATDIEAPGTGEIASIEVAEGSTVPVGAVVATWIGSNMPASLLAAPAIATGRVLATPLARRLVRQTGLNLATISGSGPRGRIKARDVEAACAAAPVPAVASSAPPVAPPAAPSLGLSERRPASSMEKTVARRMTEAKQAIPHFYVQADADVTRLLALRDELNVAEGFARVSLTHFVIAAVARTLAQMPEINRIWDADEIVTLDGIDVGLAVATERGLLAPVLRHADRMGLDGIARACGDLVARARGGRLVAEDLAGGALSVSNVGMFGASHLIPIINPGQAAILGVAAVRPAFRPNAAGQPCLCQELGFVLSCDHRVLDGVSAARFLDGVMQFLRQPLTLMRVHGWDGP